MELTGTDRSAAAAVAALKERGLWISAFGPRTVRAVTHLDVSDAEIERAGEILAEVLGPTAGAAAERGGARALGAPPRSA